MINRSAKGPLGCNGLFCCLVSEDLSKWLKFEAVCQSNEAQAALGLERGQAENIAGD